MIRESFAVARQRIEVEASDLIDLSWTPWRRIMLSARDNIWCLVDAEDYGWLSENVWNVSWGTGCEWKLYAKRNVGPARDTIRMHREILAKADPRSDRFMASHPGDHFNSHGLDNRKANLRWATHKQNARNRFKRQDIPSLDEIVRALIVGLPQQHQLEEIPF
jgi:hypothetical protein